VSGASAIGHDVHSTRAARSFEGQGAAARTGSRLPRAREVGLVGGPLRRAERNWELPQVRLIIEAEPASRTAGASDW